MSPQLIFTLTNILTRIVAFLTQAVPLWALVPAFFFGKWYLKYWKRDREAQKYVTGRDIPQFIQRIVIFVVVLMVGGLFVSISMDVVVSTATKLHDNQTNVLMACLFVSVLWVCQLILTVGHWLRHRKDAPADDADVAAAPAATGH